jgi:hypothetical protein
MKCLPRSVLGCLLFLYLLASAQDQSIRAGLIEVLANPENFNGKMVIVQGFLRIDHEPLHEVRAILYIHQEDARNLLASNAVLVLPSAQMLKDEEKINDMYVTLIGIVRTVQAGNGGYIATIKDVHGCTRWSDPGHPIGGRR